MENKLLSLLAYAHRYSARANMMNHKCECCREKRVSEKQVELTCADGTRIQHKYKVIDECQCLPTECEVPPTPTAARRRRRWSTHPVQPLMNSDLLTLYLQPTQFVSLQHIIPLFTFCKWELLGWLILKFLFLQLKLLQCRFYQFLQNLENAAETPNQWGLWTKSRRR